MKLTLPPTARETLAQFIRTSRGDRSQDDIAELIGVNQTAVSHWETGRRMPHLSNARALAAALDVEMDQLYRLIADASQEGTAA